MIHDNGGQVYLDGANMNAQVSLNSTELKYMGHNMEKGPLDKILTFSDFKILEKAVFPKLNTFYLTRLFWVLIDICQICYVYPNVIIDRKMTSKLHIKLLSHWCSLKFYNDFYWR